MAIGRQPERNHQDGSHPVEARDGGGWNAGAAATVTRRIAQVRAEKHHGLLRKVVDKLIERDILPPGSVVDRQGSVLTPDGKRISLEDIARGNLREE